MTGVSMDRGYTWATALAAFSNCSGLASYNRASDPWVEISPNGVAYHRERRETVDTTFAPVGARRRARRPSATK